MVHQLDVAVALNQSNSQRLGFLDLLKYSSCACILSHENFYINIDRTAAERKINELTQENQHGKVE